MLEQQKEQLTKEGLSEAEVFQNVVSGFLDAIPEKGPLHEKTERDEKTTRAITFGQLYNQLAIISEGAGNLNREQKAAIIKRMEELKKEAYFWTKQSDSGRNFVEEINDMSQSIWRR